MTNCCFCFPLRTGFIICGVLQIFNFLFVASLTMVTTATIYGKGELENMNRPLTKDEQEGLEGITKLESALKEYSPGINFIWMRNTFMVQTLLILISMGLFINFMCRNTFQSRYGVFIAFIIDIAAKSLTYINFPLDQGRVISDNLFAAYFIYCAYTYAQQY